MGARYLTEKSVLSELNIDATNTLNIQSLNARTYTEKYAVAAKMLSKRPDIINFTQQSDIVRGFLHKGILKLLNHTNALSGGKSIWIANKQGTVLLQSESPDSRKNTPLKNISKEPYFRTAIQGRLGRATLVESIENRSYVFASPIFDNHQIVGVTVILVPVETIERSWALLKDPIIALDNNHRVLLSNIKPWRLMTANLHEENLDQGNKNLLLTHNKKKNIVSTVEATDKTDKQQYLIVEKSIPLLDWKLVVFHDLQKIKDSISTTTTTSILGLSLFWFSMWFFWSRYQRINKEKQQQIEFANLLEQRVQRRTKAVSIANTQLEKEVEERKATETELRKTQKELIQSAKMASIGQMSTVLAHEYNQPISAIQFYAINAQTLIKESSDIDALDNMGRIEELTKRMASLTNSLRNFAHKPEQKRKKIQISTVIDQLVILMQPRLKTENVELIINHSKHDLTVMAGSTRLTQILSNLIANSIDALKDQSQKTITLEYLANNTETVEIYIKDNGPGIPVDQREKLYEAFYTTKSNQDGLGLGLFIVYNLLNELGGKLDIIDEKDYGAVFRIELERHDQEETNNDRT